MKICTWNSQGNPLNDAIKLNILNHLLTIEQCNVVILFETVRFRCKDSAKTLSVCLPNALLRSTLQK